MEERMRPSPANPKRPRPYLWYGLGAWLFLNLFINIDVFAPMPQPLRFFLPSLEVWGLLLLLSLLALKRIPFSPRIYLPMVGVLILLRLFRFGDVLVPVYFNRAFNLYVDTGYIPDLLHLLYHSFSPPLLVFYALCVLALSAVSIWGVVKCLGILHGVFTARGYRRAFWFATALLAVLVASYLRGDYPTHLAPPGTAVTPRIIEEAGFVMRIRDVRAEGLSAVQMAAAQMPSFASPFESLGEADVHLFLVESYGQTLFDPGRHFDSFEPLINAFGKGLEKKGYHAVSRFLGSPTFGGASWLAFGTLESGVWVSNQIRYHYLLNSRVKPLAAYFKAAGYRTVSVMPGTTLPWPEGAFFAYDQSYYARDLDYRGPSFGWTTMPDQFVLDTVCRRELNGRDQPLFIRYVLISSHAPFHRQPPYLADWERIGDGSVYHDLGPVTFPVNWPDLTNAHEAFLAAMAYELTVLEAFLSRCIPEDALVIIMGDHQPNRQITGEGAPWLVPVHLISRDPSLLSPFKRLGYRPGLIPVDTRPAKRMDTFLPDFLAAFSR